MKKSTTQDRGANSYLRLIHPAYSEEIVWKAPGVPKTPRGYRALALNEKVKITDLTPIGKVWGIVAKEGFRAISRPYIRKKQ